MRPVTHLNKALGRRHARTHAPHRDANLSFVCVKELAHGSFVGFGFDAARGFVRVAWEVCGGGDGSVEARKKVANVFRLSGEKPVLRFSSLEILSRLDSSRETDILESRLLTMGRWRKPMLCSV